MKRITIVNSTARADFSLGFYAQCLVAAGIPFQYKNELNGTVIEYDSKYRNEAIQALGTHFDKFDRGSAEVREDQDTIRRLIDALRPLAKVADHTGIRMKPEVALWAHSSTNVEESFELTVGHAMAARSAVDEAYDELKIQWAINDQAKKSSSGS